MRLAYAVQGSGPPLVRVATWLSHLELDWESPVWRHWLQQLGGRHTLVRYDERGCGLSARTSAIRRSTRGLAIWKRSWMPRAACPAATASWYDDVGHMPFWEAPDRFNRELADLARTARSITTARST